MKRLFGKLIADDRAATAVEYGLILALVVLVTMGALMAFASTSLEIWNDVSTKVREAR